MENKKKKSKYVIIATGTVFLLFIIGIVLVTAKSSDMTAAEKLELGEKYISELDYESAIVLYEEIITINPKCEEAYLSLAEAYEMAGKSDRALEILKKGLDETGSEAMAEMIISMQEVSAEIENKEQNYMEFVSWEDAGLENHVMDWKDANLEIAMREITGIADGDIMLSDVWEITELNLSQLNGRKYNREYLSNGGMHFNDGIYNDILNGRSVLQEATDEKKIADISALGELKNLQLLLLSNNKISDISFLKNLTNLEYLVLSYNNISDISALEQLTKLQMLSLTVNPLADISALSKLTNLNDLCLCFTGINDFNVLSPLTGLRSICMVHNNISDISGVSELKRLQHIDLQQNEISEINALSSLKELNVIYLNNNCVGDISALSNLKELNAIYLNNNCVEDISALRSLTKLEVLWLNNNMISDIRTLEDLTNLRSLYLANNNVSDIGVLNKLKKLQYLDLRNNSITDYNPIQFVIDNGGNVGK